MSASAGSSAGSLSHGQVFDGKFRTDSGGPSPPADLNRLYRRATHEAQPSIYAALRVAEALVGQADGGAFVVRLHRVYSADAAQLPASLVALLGCGAGLVLGSERAQTNLLHVEDAAAVLLREDLVARSIREAALLQEAGPLFVRVAVQQRPVEVEQGELQADS